MTASDAVARIEEKLPDAIAAKTEFRGETTLVTTPAAFHDIAAFCKTDLGFDYLIDLSSVDHLGDDPRFEVVAELYSMAGGVHLRVKYPLDEESQAPTVSDLWPTADWHEREIYDMMGIRFAGHPDLRRILMWDGYPYHPLRKDFPLEGRPSDVPDVAFTHTAPLAGGPFVTAPTDGTTQVREPRARHAGELPPAEKFIEEP